MALLDPRFTFKPFEYPEVLHYIKLINDSYWTHTKVNFDGDRLGFFKLPEYQRDILKRTALCISQIEVAVKKFWVNIGEAIPKPEFYSLGVTHGECHIEGTKILTPFGWVDFRDIEVGDKVIQFHPEDSTSCVTTVNRVIKEEYEGDIYSVALRDIEFHVTPNHEFLYKDFKDQVKVKPISKISSFYSRIKLPRTTKLNGTIDHLTDKERLYIAIQADGSESFWTNREGEKLNRGKTSDCKTYRISVKKDRKKQRLIDVLDRTGYTYRILDANKEEYLTVSIDIPVSDVSCNLKSFDWVDLSNKSHKYCEEFVKELTEWDGYKLGGTGSLGYSNTNKSCVDIAQAIGMLAGYDTKVKKYEDNRKETFNDIYKVSFIKANEWVSIPTGGHDINKRVRPDKTQYKGKIYCVSVDSGAIITRYNDRVLISKNSEVRHSMAYSQILTFLGLEQEFNNLMKEPVIQNRFAYLSKERGVDPASLAKNIAIFAMIIENVSLFSQFLIMLSYKRHLGEIKNLSNIIEWTLREEQIHAASGAYIFNILMKEYPSINTESFRHEIYETAKNGLYHEEKIVDYILGGYELPFLSRASILEFLKNRINGSLRDLGFNPVFENLDQKLLMDTFWFEEQFKGTSHKDFFSGRPVEYAMNNVSFDAESVF